MFDFIINIVTRNLNREFNLFNLNLLLFFLGFFLLLFLLIPVLRCFSSYSQSLCITFPIFQFLFRFIGLTFSILFCVLFSAVLLRSDAPAPLVVHVVRLTSEWNTTSNKTQNTILFQSTIHFIYILRAPIIQRQSVSTI